MTLNLTEYEPIARIETDAEKELSLFWRDPETGILCRCRLDMYLPSRTILDLKTTRLPLPGDFDGEVFNREYFRQAGFYAMGAAAVFGGEPEDYRFVFVALGNADPYWVLHYYLDPEVLEAGIVRARWCLRYLMLEFQNKAPKPKTGGLVRMKPWIATQVDEWRADLDGAEGGEG